MKIEKNYQKDIKFINSIKKFPIALYGAGRSAKKIIENLKFDGFNIVCIIDEDKDKQNKMYNNIQIVSKDIFKQNFTNIKIIITTPRGLNLKNLKDINNNVSILSYEKYYILQNIQKFNKIYKDIFQDKYSKKTLKNLLLAILENNNSYYERICTDNQYYCVKGFMQFENSYFVDIGAFVGDSIEKFIWLNPNFKKIVAFEPIKKQFNALKSRTNRLIKEWALDKEQIELINSPVGITSKTISTKISNSRANFYLTGEEKEQKRENEESIDIISIDDFFENKKVDLIKADIEGYELFMLKGAENTIKKQLPKLAICTYHDINDLIDIMNYISKISNSKYNFALRHHSNIFSETVLYCWI